MNTQQDISIRKKIAITIVGCVVLLFLAMYVASSQVLQKSFDKIEREGVRENTARVIDAIKQTSDLQLIKLKDWATWDDSYYYAETRDIEFTDTNLLDEALVNLDLELVMYFDAEGGIIFTKYIDHATGLSAPSDVIASEVASRSYLSTHPNLESAVGGFIMLPEGPFMASSRPLTKSDGTGPSTGTLIFGRYLDEVRVKEIANLTHLSVEVFPYSDPALSAELLEAKEAITETEPHYVRPLSDSRIVGYALLQDIEGKPMLIVRVEEPRPIFAQSTAALYSFLAIAALSVLFFGLVVLVLLERLIIRRFVSLTKQVDTINNEHDVTIHIEGSGNDDLGKLTDKINRMLSWLSDSKSKVEELLKNESEQKEKAEQMVVLRTKELYEEKARLLASINSLSFGFVIADTNDKVLVTNPALAKILELPHPPSSIHDIAQAFTGTVDGMETLQNSCKECIALKTIIELNDVSYGKKILRVICAPVSINQDGDKAKGSDVIGYVVLIEDITEAKIMERSREEFFAVASHELRTPLTAIRGNVEMILDTFAKETKNTDTREMLEDIDASSLRLITIVSDFLEVSRLEQGKIEFNITEFDIKKVVEKATRDLSGSATEKGLTVASEIPKNPLPTVRADKNRTEQVLLNLAGNALKFTREGGLRITVEPKGNFMQIRVIDTGTGISEQNQSLLFRKFQQAGEQVLARDVTNSTGLGLYISKLLVSGMGGTIGLEKSALGKGSTFVFTLPLSSYTPHVSEFVPPAN